MILDYNSNMSSEKKKQYNQIYREKNSERLKALKRAWYRQNKEAAKSYNKAYRASAAYKEKRRTQYLKNAEKYREQAREWRRRNPEKHLASVRKCAGRPEPTRERPSDCEACGRVPPVGLHLDHCHATGKFRGWLCGACNTALGLLRDNPTFISGLLTYLQKNGAKP